MRFTESNASGEASASGIWIEYFRSRKRLSETIENESLASVQYVSCANPDTLEELTGSIQRGLLSMAVIFGKTRLIDNVLIGK